ncbi:hypothetical protein SK854_05610 [Lentzea sp. BCCO 10_0061]|uniref:Uncharacterized protein n=1 Tax=Lentzea sokolovensis TaxID=3095429 RepID=A0ABU4UQ09_9PSEU|nr:hypothetical protein [Lentzea sp. BCCO 10_0061]MDX8141580.1 hypothetical protein [Lentzea sp. BCCO 10_0061]
MLVALWEIVQQVAPPRIDAFWVVLIQHSMETVRPFLAVYGDELLARQERRGGAQRRIRLPPAGAPREAPGVTPQVYGLPGFPPLDRSVARVRCGTVLTSKICWR